MKVGKALALLLAALVLTSAFAGLASGARAKGVFNSVKYPKAVAPLQQIVIEIEAKNVGDDFGWFLICVVRTGPYLELGDSQTKSAANCGTTLTKDVLFTIEWLPPGGTVSFVADKFWMPLFVSEVRFEAVLIVWQRSLQVNEDGTIENVSVHDSVEFVVKRG